MDFDFKITAWERVTVDEEYEKKVADAIKSGEISSAEQIFELLRNEDGSATYEIIDGTTDQIEIDGDDNEDYSTIEILDDKGKTIWDNSQKFKEENAKQT